MSETNLQQIVLRNLLNNEEYMRRVGAYIKKDYFEGIYRFLFSVTNSYIRKYNKLPKQQELKVELDESDKCTDQMYTEALQELPSLYFETEENQKWLLDRTEQWCQERALHNAVYKSFEVITGSDKKVDPGALPSILNDALAVSFDNHVGHDYLENADERYDFYHNQEIKLPFDLDMFNQITNGGLSKKSLTIYLAGTGVGKSLIMCHNAASALMRGKNVLYITLEMSEERIAERIDANIMDIPIDQLGNLSRDMFNDRIGNIVDKTSGKLIIKEYPTAQAHTGHFRALLNELKLKKDFVPDILFVDYINICASSRVKSMGGSINSYSYIKAIAEELRGLGVEFDLPVVSATQTTRAGSINDDPDLTDTSESFGLPATADLFLAVISNDELNAMNKYMIKQLKNRYSDPFRNRRFMIGVDKSKMKLYDVEQDDGPEPNGPSNGGQEDIPVFDKGSFGQRDSGKLDSVQFKI